MTILIGICLGLVFLFIYAFFIEPNWYRLKKVKISIPKKVHKPFTILHLSDIHFYRDNLPKKRFFQRLSMLNPDLIFITGDTLENDEGISSGIRLLSGLRARYGTYLVLGNHDYYDYRLRDVFSYHVGSRRTANNKNNLPRFMSELKRIGITVLVNQPVHVEVHGNPILIGGVDDPLTQHIDFERALHGLSAGTLNILLTHILDSLLKLSHHGVDLVFAGHTHGGQVRFPLLGPIFCETKLPRRLIDGIHDYKEMKTVVSRGLGASRIVSPRFACRPEATLYEILP